MVTTDSVRSAPTTSGGSVRRRRAGSSVTLTGRGGIVVIFGAGLLGAALGALLDVGVLSGIGFAIGCTLAALATRQADLPTLVVSPPLVFTAVTLVTEFIAALGERSLPQSLFVGMVTTFAANAPWLFLGTLIAVGIAWPRGLPVTWRALRSARPQPRDTDDDPVRWDH